MSLRITLSIPTPLAERIEEHRADESVQEYVLSALRAAVHGSNAELALRAEIARLHATVRALGGASSTTTASPTGSLLTTETDMRKGW